MTAALDKQSKKLWHTTSIYMQPRIHEFAEKLVAKMPGNLKNVYFVNSGSEANDLAIMMARLHTGAFDVISFRYVAFAKIKNFYSRFFYGWDKV